VLQSYLIYGWNNYSAFKFLLRRCQNACKLANRNINQAQLPRHTISSIHLDLIFCYNIVFGMVNVSFSSFFKFSPVTNTRGHPYKLYKSHCPHSTCSRFFAARVINVWNCLPPSVNYSTLAAFRRSINIVDFSSFLKCDID